MRARFLLCITVFLASHPLLWAQALTNRLPPHNLATLGTPDPQSTRDADVTSPAFSSDGIPIAQPLPPTPAGVPVHIAAQLQTKQGDLYTLTGNVEIHYRDYIVYADKATYDSSAQIVEAMGHLRVEGGRDNEQIAAEHGTIDLDRETAHFYQVTGSIRLRPASLLTPGALPANPLIFTGREVIKDAPDKYRVLDGSITSCQLPNPDWLLTSSEIDLDKGDSGRATAHNTRFSLLGVPMFYLPYVTHSIDTEGRQSGFLIPAFGVSSSKGTILGEQYYWAIDRSIDLTLGSEYYTERGFAPRGEFHMRGLGYDFLTASFHSLLDRRTGLANQGGTDLLVDGRRDFTSHTRAVTDLEYLSSYVYRQAFEENFSLAISSEVKSQAFVTHESDGILESLRFERYQSFENNVPPLTEIRILHTPTLEAESVDRNIPGTPLVWRFSSSLGGLSRSATGLEKVGQVRRFDIYPHLELPLVFAGWTLRPAIALRDTAYSKSQVPGTGVRTVSDASLNRGAFEAGIELRPPVLVRDFSPPWLVKLLGGDLRHTIEPAFQYRYFTGIDNFNSVLRFDESDIESDTNELEYSLTQRLFLRNLREHSCKDDEAPNATGNCGGGTVDWLTWRVAQKYFFDPSFGGAVVTGARNVLSTTLDLTGVAFLNGPRFLSPVVSRVRLRTTTATDLEWDLDYDPKLGRITSSDLFATYKHDDYSFAISHARLNAPEFAPTSPQNLAAAVSNYNQFRALFSYGSTAKRGLSLGGNAGYDFTLSKLQFGGIQSSYNWNCCGIGLEYRRYDLGSVRNENQYLYSFTLAGVGTAGNLRRAVRIF